MRFEDLKRFLRSAGMRHRRGFQRRRALAPARVVENPILTKVERGR
jgi:hypothetical protein